MSEKNLELYNQVRAVPDEAKGCIDGGRMKGKTSIEAMWRIKVLTEQFGPCGFGWYYVPIKMWTENAGEEILAFVDIELYVNYKGEWSKPIHGIGGNKLLAKEYKGINVSKECYKAATTDALSVACKQLGIGADVYWNKDCDNEKFRVSSETNVVSRSAPPVQSSRPKNSEKSGRRDLEAKYANSLMNALDQARIRKQTLLDHYGKKDIRELSFEEYKDAMSWLCSKPDKQDKPLDPRYIPPDDKGDPNSPWNSQKEKAEEGKRIAPMQESGKAGNPFPSAHPGGNVISADLEADGYTYCGSFGGN